MFYSLLVGSALVVSSVGFPSTLPAPVIDVATADRLVEQAAAACTFTSYSSLTGLSSCSSVVLQGIKVPAGKTLDLSKVADGTKIVFSGRTTFGYTEWSGPLISAGGSNVAISGDSSHVIDANGPAWWDGEGSNGGKTKPKFFAAHNMQSSTISNLNVLNTPIQAFSINAAKGLTVSGVTIDSSAGDEGQRGHNTDAFDIGSSDGVTITGANVKNQDDCMAINSGTNIHFSDGTCSGGHGLSIGSVGGRSDNTVSGIKVTKSKIVNSQNGVRIKTIAGATGQVSDVTYSGITLENITKYGIIIEQDYKNTGPTGHPTTGVPISDVVLRDITGTVAEDANPVYILCGAESCTQWTWDGVSISGGRTSSKCSNVPSPAKC